jgi:Fe-S-cluster-containing hydrogenase component 2
MRVIVQFTDLDESLKASITAHIRANWTGVTIDAEEDQTWRNGAPKAFLVIGSKRRTAVKEAWPLKETMAVGDCSSEEVLFLVDAKLGRLSKSNILGADRKISGSSSVSRRDFLFGAFHKSTQSNDAPVVLPNSCEARFGCRKCVDACPAPGALTIESKSVVVSSERCIRCGLCAGVCPVAAIQIPGMSEEAYRGLLTAIQESPAPNKTLVITCDEQSVPQLPWMDIEQVPGVGVVGVRHMALAANSSISKIIVYCFDGLCAGKENAKRAANLVSSIANETTPVVSYVEGREGVAQIERIHNSARKRERALTPTAAPWTDYVSSLKSISTEATQATGLGFTDIHIADSCTLCNACAESCPHQALAIQEGELLFHQVKCTGCGYCQQICPERSITLSDKAGTLMFDTRAVYKDEMIKCATCNAPYISAKMLSKVSETLEADKQTLRLCPTCKRAEVYRNIFGNTNTNSAKP